jgi:hypothetical protein
MPKMRRKNNNIYPKSFELPLDGKPPARTPRLGGNAVVNSVERGLPVL